MRKGPRLPPEALQPYLLPTPPPGPALPPPPAPLDWREVFGNGNPVEVEVGFGKGLHLVTAGAANPGTNYLGVEIVRKYQLFTATRLAKRGLPNVKVACGDGNRFVAACVAPGSLRAVHAYFPDPWWKKRHQKRRLFTPAFAAQCERILRPGGVLHVVTDVQEYFGIMTALLAENTRLQALPPPAEKPPAHDLDYLTNFERKFRKQGRPIYRGAFAKPLPPS